RASALARSAADDFRRSRSFRVRFFGLIITSEGIQTRSGAAAGSTGTPKLFVGTGLPLFGRFPIGPIDLETRCRSIILRGAGGCAGVRDFETTTTESLI